MPSQDWERGRETLVNASVKAMTELARMLRTMVARRVGAPPETAAEARELVALLEAHVKAMNAILKVEKGDERRREQGSVRTETAIEATAFELDLDGARGELLAELGRLHAEVEGGA